MTSSPPDWEMPAGVSRGLWDYLHSPDIARGYDAGLEPLALPRVDEAFAREYFDRPGRLLDLGCGTGRLLLRFAGEGYWVLGVDLSEEMLKVAAERSRSAGRTVHLVKANLVHLECLKDQSFDFAACLFSTLGMVSGKENRAAVVRHAFRLLRPGGRFVLHTHNRWFNAWNPAGRRWLLADLVRSALRRPDAGDRLMPVHQGVAGLTLHLFGRREAERLLLEAGFRLLETRAISLRPDGRLPYRWWFSWLRTYGYLLAAERPA